MRNVCIVGLGSIGRRHVNVLKRQGVKNVIGVDLRDDRREQAKNETDIDEVFDDFSNVFLKNKVDTVFVTLPTAFHTDVLKIAVEHECNLFIEKPVAHVSDYLDELGKEIIEKKLCTHVAYCYRFAPSVKRVKEILDSGVIGKIWSVRLEISNYLPDWHPWEDYRDFYMAKIEQGGGARLDESHGIDLLRWMFGEIDTVYSYVDTVSDLEISSDDLALMILKFRSGVTAEAHFDLLGRTPRIGMELIGSDGTLLWDRVSGKIEIFDAGTKGWTVEDFGADDFVKAYDLQAEYVIDCFRKNKSSSCDFQDGLKTLRVLEAALLSSNSGSVEKVK